MSNKYMTAFSLESATYSPERLIYVFSSLLGFFFSSTPATYTPENTEAQSMSRDRKMSMSLKELFTLFLFINLFILL